jgi:hypothetical protein
MRWLPLLLCLWACAGEDAPGRRQIRPGGEADLGRDDAQVVMDDGVVDAAPDAVPDASQDSSVDSGTSRAVVWYVLHHDDPTHGLRAALDPPHTPTEDALAATAPAPVLVIWQGPESPGATRLEALLAWGRSAAPLYDMAGRTQAAATDGSWLVARALQHPSALRVGDRPVLVLRPAPDRAGLSDLRARLAMLPVAPFVVLEAAEATRPWPAADAVLPALPYGQPLDPQGEPGEAEDARRRQADRTAALEAGWPWLPRAGPLPNHRLTDPTSRVLGGPDQDDLVRSLVLARQHRAPALPVVVVDGLGAWADDRQLDAVDGPATRAPGALTDERLLTAYGNARLAAVEALLGGPSTTLPTLDNPPILLSFSGRMPPTLEAGEAGVRVVQTEPGTTWLLAGRPFTLPADTTLTYARDTAEVAVDLRFADGALLSDLLAQGTTTGPQAVRLDAFAGRVVLDVLLVANGPGTLSQMRFVSGL